jgi:hypothetical protein
MARTLFMADGSTEVIFGSPAEALERIIEERLGRDCEQLYEEILSEMAEEAHSGDDYERTADGYRGMLVDTMNALWEVLSQPRLSRKKLERIHGELDKNL